MRTLGLRLIPGDIIDECMDQILVTQQNADAEDPDAAKRKLFDAFAAQGVQANQLKEYLGHDASVLAQKEITDLRSLYAALRDGETTWREVMDSREAGEKKSTGLDAVRAATSGKKAKTAEAPQPTLADRIAAASDLQTLQALGEEMDALPDSPEKEELAQALLARENAITG